MLNIPWREENPLRYDANKEINDMISKAFNKSVSWFISSDIIGFYEKTCGTTEKIKESKKYANIPYAEKTLGESGCAVFCFEHGLRTRGIECSIEELAKEIGEKGYYFYGKGTYHNLFDHYGLRRASDVREIFETLKMGKIVTVLVLNKLYPLRESDQGSHFVNIIGTNKHGHCLVADSQKESEYYCNMKDMLASIRVAWIW